MAPDHSPIRVASVRDTDSRQAGVELGQALVREGMPDWVLVFCGGKHNPTTFLEGLRTAVGSIPVVGGTVPGAIMRAGFSYAGFEAAGAAFAGQGHPPLIVTDDGLLDQERAAGARLARRLAANGSATGPALIFYDSIASRPPDLRLHPASPLVEGLHEGMGHEETVVVGAGMCTDMNLNDGWIFDGTGIARHGAVVVGLGPDYQIVSEVMHGCRPASSFMTVTRLEGAEVFELDGRPAYDVILERLGGESALPTLTLALTLGAKHGDLFAPFDENAYVNRLILGADRERGSITLFEPDFTVGDRVQLMSRDNDLMLDSVRRGTGSLQERCASDGHWPVALALYIDCAGRASARSGAEIEEAAVLLESLSPQIPLLGFYSGVEVAPVAGRSRPLDWTAVLAFLRRRPTP